MFFHQKNHRRHITGKNQTGVAIITALLSVTIAATVSITISTQLQLDVRRTGNLVALDQAEIYASFIEDFTRDTLENEDNFEDLMTTLRESGRFEATYPVENGTVLGEITDLNSCINLNALIDTSSDSDPDSSSGPPTINPITRSRLERLFNNNGIPKSMIAAIIDWIDADSNTTDAPDGGEDGYYLNLEQPYYTANQPLTSITELRLIKGAESSQENPSYAPYNKILALAQAFRNDTDNWPSLCAFRTDNASPALINVNTASKDVLLSLAPTMTTAIAEDIISCRGENGAEFTNIEDFTSCSNVGTIIRETDRDQLAFTSDYFLLKTKVNIGDAKKITYSIIFRDPAGTTEIIARTQRTL
ncbi:MAG: type II secretion system minor pseudopilin GspK [Gammaproteobacteria bacterium]|nr:type II secretion system minor pseudopilin GspK [Gammaproteobacteria bacterium]